jgi:hypothetical protein
VEISNHWISNGKSKLQLFAKKFIYDSLEAKKILIFEHLASKTTFCTI